MTSKRERLAWLAFVAIIAIVAVTIPAGVSPTSRDLEFTATLMELRQRVEEHYVREVSDEELRLAAIQGMLRSLDENSIYVPPSAADAFNQDLQGTFEGVGILVDREDTQGGLLVVRPIEESPAEEVTTLHGRRIAPEGVRAENPAFDVTPAELIAAIVTEHGRIDRPDAARVAALLRAAGRLR